jgi:hypothetical protein
METTVATVARVDSEREGVIGLFRESLEVLEDDPSFNQTQKTPQG